jgi:Protein of unknown function (DUF2628)
MALFSVYLPASNTETAEARAEKARFIRDGFSWGAFLFPVLWLLWHRVWRWALFFLAVDIALLVIGQRGGLPSTSLGLLGVLEMGFAGFEARHWFMRALERQGYVLDEVIEAPSRDEAEFIFFDRLAAERKAKAPIVSHAPVSRSSGVIGLFPQPGLSR